MIPYRVSVWAPRGSSGAVEDIKLYGTYAECDDEALRIVADVMPGGWRVDRIAGLMARAEVESLRLAPGEVRELSSFAIEDLLLDDQAGLEAGSGGFRSLHPFPHRVGSS